MQYHSRWHRCRTTTLQRLECKEEKHKGDAVQDTGEEAIREVSNTDLLLIPTPL